RPQRGWRPPGQWLSHRWRPLPNLGERMTAGAIHIDAMLDDSPLDCPRTSVIRRLDALAEMQIIVRRDTRCYLNELVWQRRTNLSRRVTNPARAAKRLTSRTAEGSQSNMKTVKGPDETDVAVGRRLKSLRVRCGLLQTALGME